MNAPQTVLRSQETLSSLENASSCNATYQPELQSWVAESWVGRGVVGGGGVGSRLV